jgi:WD40 repeat protein
MVRILIVVALGAGLFFAAAWYLGLLDFTEPSAPHVAQQREETASEDQLGDFLYKPGPYPEVEKATRKTVSNPIVLYGVMNPTEEEEVPSQVPGALLFIGEEVDEGAALAAGSAAFMAEPYFAAEIRAGEEKIVRFYRRINESESVRRGQMLAMVNPAKAWGEVQAKIAKVDVAVAERDAAIAGEKEGRERYERAIKLYNSTPRAITKEDLGSAELTYKKLASERVGKEKGVVLAQIEKKQADIELKLHEIRAQMPYEHMSVKTIIRRRGYAAKQYDPVIIVQNLERLQAEALIEEQYFAHIKDRVGELRNKKLTTATIEPTIVERSLYTFPGHDLDVTSVAVTRDRKIVSGSEDRSVCVWEIGVEAPLRKLEHDDPVRVVACAPAGEKNLCLAGCANGSIFLWDLDAKDDEPIKVLANAHGDNAGVSITALAFSADGKLFASGASDGSIRLWKADGTELYPFVPKHGVKQCHEDAVTALQFTPQCRLVSAGRDKTLRVWKLKEKGAVPDRKAIYNRDGNVPQLGVSHDGKWMLFDQGRTLKLLSVETHTLRHTMSVPANSPPFDTLALFSPDNKLILTSGAPEGRLQLWTTPHGDERAFEVRQFATRDRLPVNCAAFSPAGDKAFAVSASGQKIYVWPIPTEADIKDHRVQDVPITLLNHTLDPSTRMSRIGFVVDNPRQPPRYPNGRFEAGRPVTIVIE